MDDSTVDMQSKQKQAFDLDMSVGDLALDEAASSDDVSLEGLQKELEEFKNVDVNEKYLKTLEKLSKKLKFVEFDSMAEASKALKDVQPELERLQQKAVSKVFEFIMQKLSALRKPKPNIKALQRSVLIYKYLIIFLKEHGGGRYNEVRVVYIDVMNKILSSHFCAYTLAMEKSQLDIATSSDLIGVQVRSTTFLESLKNRSPVFAMGNRIDILKQINQSALMIHLDEVNSRRYPYEVLFESLHKLLMDTATSEYLFCDNFFGEEDIFYEIMAGPFAVLGRHLNVVLQNCYDAIGLMLMIRIVNEEKLVMFRRRIPCLDSYLDKVNISLWPRFKLVFDMHLNSLRNANIRSLWEENVQPHYVMRRYAEFTASLILLHDEYGDCQFARNLENLRKAIDGLLVKLAKNFTKPKSRTIFLMQNYDMTIAVLKEASIGSGRIQTHSGELIIHFEKLLISNITIFVEEIMLENFNNLTKFVKSRGPEESSSNAEEPLFTDVALLVRDFACNWKASIKSIHKDVIGSFSNLLLAMDILRAILMELLSYYRRFKQLVSEIEGGTILKRDLVSVASVLFEMKKYLRIL